MLSPARSCYPVGTDKTRDTRSTSGHFHAVRFYENKTSLSRTVSEFLAEGLATGQPALIIATPEHREAVLQDLRARNIDVEKAQAAGDFEVLDARQVLSTFMVDGMPDAALFKQHVPEAIDRLCRGRKDCTIRAYGEMVDVLWQDGLTAAAIKLEMFWNRLAMTHDFSLLCGYAMGSFYKDAGMRDVCDQHSHVVPAANILSSAARHVTVN
jgi:DcmR-like sensory protein